MGAKGSLWRKWDFHVHTPVSIETSFGDDWDQYVRKLVEAAERENVSAIGITDYFSVEGYKKLKQEYFENESKLRSLFSDHPSLIKRAQELFVFPNIEFRLDSFVGESSINFHVIFSNNVSISDIEDYFLGEIDFVFKGRPQDQSLKMKVKRANLETLGQRVKVDQPNVEGSNYKIGIQSAVVSLDNIKKVLTQNPTRFSGKYLIGPPPDEDLSDVDWAGRDGDTRRQIIAGSDFLLASNPKTQSWALGKKAQKKEEFLTEFQSLKPCIWGSDAHSYENLLKPKLQRYCWVKADLTFEGLRQIKFEPEFRVAISATKPDEKVSYYTIDRVRFRDGPDPTFSTDWIEINPNLTTIIGGKSSGKSLLLYYLAKTINPSEAEKLKTPAGQFPYDCESNPNFDFEVHWSDGEINRLRQDAAERRKKITYLPQLYINSLVEGKSRKELNRLIEDVLLENDSYSAERNNFNTTRRLIDANIEKEIAQLFSLLDQKQKLADALAKTGDKQAHIKQVETLRDKISQLTKDSSLTDHEREQLTTLRESHKSLTKESTALELDLSHYKALKDILGQELAEGIIDNHLGSYIDIIPDAGNPSETFDADFASIQLELSQALGVSLANAGSKIDSKIKELSDSIAKNHDDLKKVVGQLEPFAGKFKNKEELAKHETQLKEQSVLLSQIEAYEKKASEISAQIIQAKNQIWIYRAKYREGYQSFVDFIKASGFDKIADDITLLVEMKFDEDDFHSSVVNYLHLNSLKKAFPEQYDESTQRLSKVTLETFKSILEGVLGNEIKLKGGTKRDDLLRRLLRNFLSISFNLKHRGDDLLKMSPGKRGIVVLKVLLHLSNSKDPILIDQPEDNLDNRTIYEELNTFIQEKKRARQIIMVTHNANLVVAADAEEVIVCNQGGQQTGRDNKRFTFEYLSGPLEHTFHDETQLGILFQKGVKEHVCEVLEGGKEAFISRQSKYQLT